MALSRYYINVLLKGSGCCNNQADFFCHVAPFQCAKMTANTHGQQSRSETRQGIGHFGLKSIYQTNI